MRRKNLHRKRQVNRYLDETMSQRAEGRLDGIDNIISSSNESQPPRHAPVASLTPQSSVTTGYASSNAGVRRRSHTSAYQRSSLRHRSQSIQRRHRVGDGSSSINILPISSQTGEASTHASSLSFGFRPATTQGRHAPLIEISQFPGSQNDSLHYSIPPSGGYLQQAREFPLQSQGTHILEQPDVHQRLRPTCALVIFNSGGDGIPIISRNDASPENSTIFTFAIQRLELQNHVRPAATRSSRWTQYGLVRYPYSYVTVNVKTEESDYIENVNLIIIERPGFLPDTEAHGVNMGRDFWTKVYAKRNEASQRDSMQSTNMFNFRGNPHAMSTSGMWIQ
ncbi:hypothetical protein F5B20DRAFT_541608 [Whalleya microplaca]|nr:hypothetical protein F5B20DRAFT_541608 [Whalleya microplaca]